MRDFIKQTLAIFLNLAFFANQLLADLPPITFDSAEWAPYQAVGDGSTPGWQLFSGNASVSSAGMGFNGGKALKLPVNPQQEAKISRTVSWDVTQKTAFIDFRLKPAADPSGNASTFLVNGTRLAFQVPPGSNTGEIWVYNGGDTLAAPNTNPGQWIKSVGTFDVNGTVAASYLRVTLRHDYLRNVWDLFIDGKMIAANLAFDNRGANLEELDFYGSKVGDTFIDDLSVQTGNMLFTDTDKDGLPDAWESAHGSNPLLYDRDAINPLTGRSFLDSYLDSLWPQGTPINANPIVVPFVTIPPLTILDQHQSVGALKGSLSVGGDGTANYAVPIDIPKGTAGMEPKLSLGYSSNAGNGITGVGWNLSGLQTITRGPSSAAKDGAFDPMDFDVQPNGDTKDRFFLDGERLICISGHYGAAGSIYRTEMDSYARITAMGTSIAGPAYWKVETKAGLIVYLGQTADSKISVTAGTLSWAVNQVEDTAGNYYKITYIRDASTADFDFVNQRVSKIDYTGSLSPVSVPYCSITFAFLNKGRAGPGWIQDNSYALPVPLMQDGQDQGRRILDLNGDGIPEIAQSRYIGGNGLYQRTYSLNKSGNPRWSPPSDDGTGPLAYYNLPVGLLLSSNNSSESVLADLNGDGLVDVLYSDSDHVIPPNSDHSGSSNLAFLNNGNGWKPRDTWGLPSTNRFFNADSSQADRLAGKRDARLQDINGDGFPDLITGLLGETPKVWYNQCKAEVLVSVIDGFGTELTVSYRRLNDPSPIAGFNSRVYEKCVDALPAGQAAIIDSRLVVSRYTEPDGKGGTNYKAQRYADLRYDRFNEASLGFGSIDAMDELTGQISHTETYREFPFGGSPKLTTTSVMVNTDDLNPRLPGVTVGMKCLSTETATYDELPSQSGIGGTIRRPVQTSSIKKTFDLDGSLKAQTQTTQNVGDFNSDGFVLASTVAALNGSQVSTVNSYTQYVDAARWQLGRLTSSTVTKSGGGMATITKKSTFSYDSISTGMLASETIEPGNALSVTKIYTRDSYGNVIGTSVTASGESHTASSTYDSKGRFVTSESNQLGHTVSYLYDGSSALLISTTAADLTTAFFYDTYGTLIRTLHPDGTETGEITGWATNASVPAAVANKLNRTIKYFRAKQSSGMPVAKVYLDAMGRELVTETLALRDASASSYAPVYTVTTYDWRNRKTAGSNPFASGETVRFTQIEYDFLNRAINTTQPDGTMDYVEIFDARPLNGQPVTYSKSRNRLNQALERWEDQHGRLVQSRDASGQTTVFNYDSEGRLLAVAINGQTLLTNTFDLFGNKKSVTEANSGTSTSSYNGFGEVVSSTNAKGQTTTFDHDVLGRPTTIAKQEGTYTTRYDGAVGNGLGKPWKTYGPDGYQEEISYDTYGRPVSSRKTQFGETFYTANTYDALGRPYSETNAGGLTVIHEYDSQYSVPIGLRIGPGVIGAGTVLWHAGTYDSQGHALTQTLAQGVTQSASYFASTGLVNQASASAATNAVLQNKSYIWDPLGNLSARADFVAKRVESFGYDGLNRVTGANTSLADGATNTTLPPPQAYTYDPNGNLRTKAGATLTYGGARPHAVSSATVKGQQRTYTYDAAGYITSDSKRTYAWTSFGQLAALDYLSAPVLQSLAGTLIYAAARVQTDFSFDAGGNRAKQLKTRIAADDSRQLEETLYLGSYECEIRMTQATGHSTPRVTKIVHRHTLGGLGIYTRADSTSGSEIKLTTLLKDHLGSTDLLYTGT